MAQRDATGPAAAAAAPDAARLAADEHVGAFETELIRTSPWRWTSRRSKRSPAPSSRDSQFRAQMETAP
ncbi:MAG: hypothetical protein DHS20C14_07030 [Phycisphaeraceae bacterium]|nr:MAG: hypothetical protein DHS20C14_07030 [Phycisphaeraceae bacterium]